MRKRWSAASTFFLTRGVVRSYTYDADGNDVTTGLYCSGEIVCELSSFFRRIPSEEIYETITDCHFKMITYDNLQEAFHGIPEFREFGRAILVNAFSALKSRMISSLRLPAEQRYGWLVQNKPEILKHTPLKHIASYLGVTDTSLSRIRKDFAKKKR